MPTYKNIGEQNVQIEGIDGTSFVSPGSTIETYEFKVHIDLEEISKEPIYSPVIETVELSGILDEVQTQTVYTETQAIIVRNTGSEAITLYNTLDTYPIVTLESGGLWGWNCEGRIQSLLIKFLGESTATIIQMRESSTYE